VVVRVAQVVGKLYTTRIVLLLEAVSVAHAADAEVVDSVVVGVVGQVGIEAGA